MQKMKKTIEGSGSDLFICFTSRPSAASASAAASATMRVPSSKSLMSPNRSGGSNPSIPSLSSSLSRRLRSSGSIKGGQSPMFPAAGAAVGRKKGVAFETAEPSSPKVTCIGQVRVKSKKKKSKNAVTRTRSGREASFRRCEATDGRKAVSICDALRAFGSEMNCFVPCGWSLCSSGEGEQRKRKKRPSSSSSSCGAVFARWLMAIEEEDEEAEKGRELVGLVVEERGKGEVGVFVREKEVELEVEEFFERRKEEIFERKGEVVVVEKQVGEEEEAKEEEMGRVSVCIPPSNALLLMRCRSDPVRMAELANRFWDSPAMKVQCEEPEEEDEEEVGNEESEKVVGSKIDEEKEEEEEEGEVGEDHVEQVSLDIEEAEKVVVLDEKKVEALEEEKIIVAEEAHEEMEKEVQVLNLPEEEEEAWILGQVISAEKAALEEEKLEGSKAINELIEKEAKEKEVFCVQRGGEDEGEEVDIILRRSISCSATKSNELAKAKEGAKRRSFSYREKKEKRRHSFSTERDARRQSFCSEKEARISSFSIDKDGRRCSFSIEKENLGPKEKPIVVQSAKQTKKEEVPASAMAKPVKTVEPKSTEKTQAAAGAADEVREKILVSERDETQVVVEKEKKSRELPDCLLLMMYEPKLSMEVSKETWVCSTDFQWRPNYSHPTNQPSEAKTKANDGSKAGDKCIENKNVIAENAAIAQPPPLKPPLTEPAIELKLLKSSAIGPLPPLLPQPSYEHFVLTRCKSEPLKSSVRLAPDACFWKSRHQPIGTAGIGF